ncbi:MAG: lytic transglycosylase domain-containing protein, partial [Clostridia bacterium]|nr:lytic transglycosylase domain-containing protein [Clostridia bacterium]
PAPGARAASARPHALRAAAPADAAQAWLAETVTRDALAAWLDAHYAALPAGTRASIAEAVVREASRRGVDPWLVVSVIKVESDFNPDEVGSAGEIGLMQVLPGTARLVARNVFGIDGFDPTLLFDPDWNIRIAVAYLADRLRAYRGDAAMALTSYNAGDGVKRPNAYARAVLGWYARIAPGSATTP